MGVGGIRTEFWWENLRERGLDINARIILNCILKK
jgi:hypothetical protein